MATRVPPTCASRSLRATTTNATEHVPCSATSTRRSVEPEMTADPEMLESSERAVRRALVTLEHMNSENTQEWDRTIKTFSHARYELPDGRIVDGRDDVMAYW